MATDKFSIKVEDDGTITVTTDKISPQQHFSAEQFIEWTAKQLGGTHSKARRSEAHHHDHVHDHDHDHVHDKA